MNELTHLSLFSGIGGLDLAGEWAGFRTVGQCEWAEYPRKVLEKYWPGLPRWRDIRTLTKESFYEQTGMGTVTVVSGGFPCQPFSTAGKRRGKEDDRYLWPEMLRVIQEIRPCWVVGENVAGIVSMELDTVLSDLEAIGYSCQALIIPACAVDAKHRRDRCAILAHTNNTQTPRQREHGGEIHSESKAERSGLCGSHVAYANCNGLEKQGMQGLSKESTLPVADNGWWPAEPNVGRVAHGVPARVDRLKCLGNAVVPQQFYPIFQAIAELEKQYELQRIST